MKPLRMLHALNLSKHLCHKWPEHLLDPAPPAFEPSPLLPQGLLGPNSTRLLEYLKASILARTSFSPRRAMCQPCKEGTCQPRNANGFTVLYTLSKSSQLLKIRPMWDFLSGFGLYKGLFSDMICQEMICS
jgi:hypothetical protein